MTKELLYHADYLGPVNEVQLKHVVGFLEHDGPAGVLSRLPYLSERNFSGTPAVLSHLHDLDTAVRTKIGMAQFLTVYRSHYELGNFDSDWAWFQGAVGEIFCGDYARSSGLLSNNTLVTDQQLADNVAKLTDRHRALEVRIPTIHFRYGGIDYDLPDAIDVEIKDGHGVVTAVHEYKSTTDSGADRDQFERTVKPFLAPGPKKVLQEAIRINTRIR